MGIGSFFKSLLSKVWGVVKSTGITDALMKLGIAYAKEAALKFTDNTQRREWVVQQLVTRGIPESVARLIVELAVQFIKKEAAGQTQQ